VSLFFGTKNVGVVISAYFGGLLLEYFDKKSIFQMAAILPLTVAILANMLPEPKNTL